MQTRKTERLGVIGGFMLLTAAALTLHGSVYDDCHAWWHLDFDYNNDGLAQKDDIRDQRSFHLQSTPDTSVYNADSVHGSRGAPQWTNMTVVSPAGGVSYGGKSMYFEPVTNAAGACWPDAYRVNTAAISYSATVVTRFRWDGFASIEQQPSWICNNGLDWTNYKGWMFGVVKDGVNARLAVNVRRAGYNLGAVNVQTGVWYEAAAVLTHEVDGQDTVELYIWGEGGRLQNQKWNVASVTNASTHINVGGEDTYNGYSTGNAFKSFRGAVNHLALWSRPLSRAEVAEAFGAPQPAFQIGLENNSSSDLGYDSEANALYTPGQPWHLMRRAVKGGSTSNATVEIEFSAQEAALNHVFHVNTYTPDSKPGLLSLTVNGVPLSAQTAGNDSDLVWFLTPDLLASGTNSFKLAYMGGDAAYIAFDWLQIAGSWQLGVQNNSAGEFENEGVLPDDFYVTDPNLKNMERAITHSDRRVTMNFSLTQLLAAEYDFTYTTRVVQQGGVNPPHPFSIEVNGTTIQSYEPLPDNTTVSVKIPPGILTDGPNAISVVFTAGTTTGWLQFDFHRLEVSIRPPAGTLILVQ